MSSFWHYALLILLCSFLVTASSVPPRPLKRIAHPTTLSLEILPRQVSPKTTLRKRSSSYSPFLDSSLDLTSPTLFHSDSFRLTLSAFDDIFHLHLRPNDHLIHPAARINYYTTTTSPDGTTRQKLAYSVPLIRESVRAYWGEVIAAEHSQQRMREDAAGVVAPRPITSSGSNGIGVERGWARIVVHSQGDADSGIPPSFEGAFEVDGVTYHVQTRENYLRNKQALDPDVLIDDYSESHLVIWRDSDAMRDEDMEKLGIKSKEHGGGCVHDTLEYNTDPWQNEVLQPPPVAPSWFDPFGILSGSNSWENSTSGRMIRRDDVQGGSVSNNFSTTIGKTTGCPTSQKILYMGVAADCAYVSAYGSTQNATQQIITNWNSASSIYKSTFNVSLGIVQIDVQEPTCPSSAPTDAPWNVACDTSGVDLNDRLSLFSQWRGDKGNDGTGLWHLMSGCPTGSEVGVAWLGTLCQQTAQGNPGSVVSGTAVSTNGRTEWEVVSHEIGHNFGAIHDCQSTCGTSSSPVCCPLSGSSCNANDAYIMSPVTSSTQKQFSACTIGNICSLMQATASGHVNNTCLQDPDPSRTTLSLNMCGNGIVEQGEECDPGQNVTSSCCDSSTCKLLSGAQCDPASSACCTDQCSFASAQTVCRPAVDAKCDIAESCTGSSADCPADTFEPNGQSCGDDGLACANGVCTSLNAQCSSAGSSLNLTTACSTQDNSCRVSCQDPSSSSQCIQLQTALIDGSSCGLGGTCQSGTCVAGSLLDTAKAWYVQNLQISIPVTIVVAIIVLLIIYALCLCIKRNCMRRKAVGSMEPALVGQRSARLHSWQAPIPPYAVRPQPTVPAPVVTTYGNVAPSRNVARSGSSSGTRRASIPTSLRPSGPVPPPSSYNANTNNSNNSASSRNRSWDGVYGPPTGGGSARMPRSNERPGSSDSTSSRARAPAFPAFSGSRNLEDTQERNRRPPPPPPTRPSHWVDPEKWNGPAR